MKRIYYIFYITLIWLFICTNSNALNLNDHRIAVIVNDQMITSYDVIQRMKINAILNGINITPENNERLANAVIEELIQEMLKNEKIIEYDILISDQEYSQYEEEYFQNKLYSKDDLLNVFKENKIDFKLFNNYLVNEISWQKLIAGMYYRLTSVSETEIEEIISKNSKLLRVQAENIIIQRQLDLKSTKLLRDMLNEATIEYR